MSDFSRDFFIDTGITIKQEPLNDTTMINTSASVPIPSKREASDYRDFGIDLENSQSPLYTDVGLTGQIQAADIYGGNIYWGHNRIINTDEMLKSEALIHMDDDDIFQVDKADLIQGPTLAELNANDETLLGDLNFDDLLLPEESTYITLGKNTSYSHTNTNHMNNNPVTSPSSCPPQGTLYYKELDLPSSVPTGTFDYYNSKTPVSTLSPGSQHSSSSSIIQTSSPIHVSNLQQKHSTLHELLMKGENYVSPDRSILGQSVPGRNTSLPTQSIRIPRGHNSRLSSSAPTHLGLEQLWQRREPRKHLLSTSSQAEAGSTSSLSTGGILSPDPPDFSHDEESDEDSDGHYEDFSSDNADSDDDDEHGGKSASKKERYFWQYNVQAKGPKGQRLVMKCKMEDPHCLNEITDPVFSPDCSVRGIKHSGKARKGDGNDLTPNARKLFNIGKELDKLGRIINDMTPVSELPFNVRPTSRKEKNKLASRACRLKKKAQHEANKIKLSGLESEHKRLINGLQQAKHILAAKLSEQSHDRQEELTMNLDKIYKNCTIKIAGHTTEYVNKVLDKVRNGVHTTGAAEDL